MTTQAPLKSRTERGGGQGMIWAWKAQGLQYYMQMRVSMGSVSCRLSLNPAIS